VTDHRDQAAAPAVAYVVRKVASYPDISDSLARMVADGFLREGKVLPVDPTDMATSEDHAWARIIEYVDRRRTEIVILHHFHSRALADPRNAIEQIRTLSHRPIVALTNGDAFFNGVFRPSFPKMFLQAAQAVDLVFSTSMGVTADYLIKHSSAPIALLPHGVCQARFQPPSICALVDKPEFSVTFIGSNNRPRNPLKSYHWFARQRERMIRLFSAHFGRRFAVFGHGWEGFDSWQGPVPFAQQQAACRRSELVIGGIPFSKARYYASDRAFNQIASGVPFLDLAVDGIDRLLRQGEHWHLAGSVQELLDRCDELLCTDRTERQEFGRQAAQFAFREHSVEARCRSLIATLRAARSALHRNSRPAAPDLRFLLPEVDRRLELPLATRGWVA
jgi:hypothetical protein